MYRRTTIAALAITALILTAYAMEPNAVEVDQDHYTVEFENDRVRVIRIKYGPGEESVMHSHGPTVVVGVTGARTQMTFPDGSSIVDDLEAGGHQWADAGDHLPKNVGSESMEALLIELKD